MISIQPPDPDALYAAADAYSELGTLSMKRAQQQRRKSDWSDARSWYQQTLNTWHRIDHPNHTALGSFQVRDPATVAKTEPD